MIVDEGVVHRFEEALYHLSYLFIKALPAKRWCSHLEGAGGASTVDEALVMLEAKSSGAREIDAKEAFVTATKQSDIDVAHAAFALAVCEMGRPGEMLPRSKILLFLAINHSECDELSVRRYQRCEFRLFVRHIRSSLRTRIVWL